MRSVMLQINEYDDDDDDDDDQLLSCFTFTAITAHGVTTANNQA